MPDLIVIGAGLSGLALARAAAGRGAEVVVLEARPRIGGRVLSHRTEAGAYDLGPAWVWPGIQPRIARAVRAAGLALTEQAEAGGFIYQDQTGRIQRLPHGFAQEPPSMRITGGIAALVEAVAAGLAPGVVRLEHAVRRIALTGSGVAVTAETRSGPMTLHAARAALALPPRLIGGIEIVPTLPPSVGPALAAVPGWMAGQAKALVLYDRPVWRDAGLSGSAFSQTGPLGELHDASLPGAAEAALFGFFSWPPALRAARRAAVPPRLIGGIEIVPTLPPSVGPALAAVPGWMAGQAKALVLYDRPVWRDAGLSGSAFSQTGPLGELHDASLPGAAEAALFGFFSWPPALRAARRAAVPELVARQLGMLFGAEAARPREVIIQDWATDPFTATEADHANGNAHPDYRPIALPASWGERITLAGAEMAPEFGGYLEGALAAAEAAVIA